MMDTCSYLGNTSYQGSRNVGLNGNCGKLKYPIQAEPNVLDTRHYLCPLCFNHILYHWKMILYPMLSKYEHYHCISWNIQSTTSDRAMGYNLTN